MPPTLSLQTFVKVRRGHLECYLQIIRRDPVIGQIVDEIFFISEAVVVPKTQLAIRLTGALTGGVLPQRERGNT